MIFGGIASQYGTGEDITIADLARLIAQVTGYRGELVFDPSRPDGTPQKLLDISKLRALGWKARTPLALGLARSYADFLAQGGGHSVGKTGMWTRSGKRTPNFCCRSAAQLRHSLSQ
jgi:hypothetical protein